MLTQAKVKELFDYREGKLFWKVSLSKRTRVDTESGTCRNGYVEIKIKGKLYPLTRLLWLWHYGYFPENKIRKIDQSLPNYIGNLREVSNSCAVRVAGNHANNTTGIKGVGWYKRISKWVAYIAVEKKHVSLGYYKDFTDAACARLAAEQCLGWEECHMTSPAFQYVQKHIGGKHA